MALRRDQHQDTDRVSLAGEQEQPGQIVEHRASRASSVVRPEMLAIGRAVIAERRELLERLAAYDRGDKAEP